MKKYCRGFTHNVDEKTGELKDNFCKFYNGSKKYLESCSYQCSNTKLKSYKNKFRMK